ncbi:MAG: hypothetical protein ACJ788_24685 [Ktedonobacteraceae bacterium]
MRVARVARRARVVGVAGVASVVAGGGGEMAEVGGDGRGKLCHYEPRGQRGACPERGWALNRNGYTRRIMSRWRNIGDTLLAQLQVGMLSCLQVTLPGNTFGTVSET